MLSYLPINSCRWSYSIEDRDTNETGSDVSLTAVLDSLVVCTPGFTVEDIFSRRTRITSIAKPRAHHRQPQFKSRRPVPAAADLLRCTPRSCLPAELD